MTDTSTNMVNGKRSTTHTWAARNPKDCLDDLIDFCSSLRSSISTRFHRAVPNVTIQLYNMFDLEKALTHLCNFTVQNGKLITTREHKIEWETYGVNEFNTFFQVVCNILHVRVLADSDSSLMLLPHNSVIMFKRFKDTLEKIIWFGLGNRFDLFVDMKGNFLPQFQDSHLLSMSAVDSAMLDQIFNLKFASGVEVTAKLQEDNLIASFYNEKVIYECLGKEMCISLDVALAASGCEAIVEGFYSLVTAHKKSGDRSNDILIQRAIVDWSIPDPITCPKTMTEIANLYTDGNKKLGIAKHRLPRLFDERGRALRRHDVSKVVDRLRTEKPQVSIYTSS